MATNFVAALALAAMMAPATQAARLHATRDILEEDMGMYGGVVGRFEKCGGNRMPVIAACAEMGDVCVKKNPFYAQCITPFRAATNVAEQGWDGEVLVAGEMFPFEEMSRKLLSADEDLLPASRDLLEEDMGMYGGVVGRFEKCGGNRMPVIAACAEMGDVCVKKNPFYAQCITPFRAATNVAEQGWDGEVLVAGEMFPFEEMSRKLLDADVEILPASADPLATDMGMYGGVVGRFEKCGGNRMPVIAACAEMGDVCVKKNPFYAQCITPFRAATNVAEQGWDGEVLVAGEMFPFEA